MEINRFEQTESFVIDRDITRLNRSSIIQIFMTLVYLGMFIKYTPFYGDFVLTVQTPIVWQAVGVGFVILYVFKYAYYMGTRASSVEYGFIR